MLTDIFSSFDPETSSLFNNAPSFMFWATNFLFLAILTSTFWIAPNSIFFITANFKSIMASQVTRSFGSNLKGFSLMLTSIFVIMATINLLGLIPYVFSTSSHLFITLSMALPLWLSLIFSSAQNSISSFTAGILPSGAPDWLNPFLILVETVSIMVRPITLSFRLAANMSAGHIVLGLMGIYAASSLFSSIKLSLFIILIQMFYLIFELGICLIQAYIFCLLLSLYSEDHTT